MFDVSDVIFKTQGIATSSFIVKLPAIVQGNCLGHSIYLHTIFPDSRESRNEDFDLITFHFSAQKQKSILSWIVHENLTLTLPKTMSHGPIDL